MKDDGRYVFVTDCRGSTFADISDLNARAKRISREAFTRKIGGPAWGKLQKRLGFGPWLPITKDPLIGYYRSSYRGIPAVFARWSGVEFIFTLDGDVGPSLARNPSRLGRARRLSWTLARRSGLSPHLADRLAGRAHPKHVIVWARIDRAFAAVGPDYRLDVARADGGPNAIGDRIPRALARFRAGAPMDPPLVGVYLDTLEVVVCDGRHRCVATWRLGAREAPFIVPRAEARAFKAAVGA